MGGIEVRSAEVADKPALVSLFHEMERLYEGETAIDLATVAGRLEAGAFAPGAPAEVLVAERGGRIVGFASFGTLFPGRALRCQIYLKELFVGVEARRAGVGQALLAALARLARERGIGEITWATGSDNGPARNLYDGVGARIRPSIGYILDGDALNRLAERADGR